MIQLQENTPTDGRMGEQIEGWADLTAGGPVTT